MTFASISLSRASLLKVVLFGALAIGMLSMAAGRGTLAFFTSRVTSTANTFTAGNLHFQIANFNGSSPSAVSDTTSGTVASSITLTDIKPGDTIYAPISITNAGSLDSQWGISYTTSGTAIDLANGLQMGVVGNGPHGATATTDCTPAGFVDTTLFPQRIRTLVAMVPTGPTTLVSSTASAPVTTQTGGFVFVPGTTSLPLIHGATDILCVEVSFPNAGAPANPDDKTSGDNAWNGPTNSTYATTLVFTFDARQHDFPVVMDETSAAVTGNR